MAATLHLDAVLTPHRSLSKAGLWCLLGILAVFNILVGVLFVVIGARPIPAFLGLDFLGVLLAFHISYRQAKRRERILVSADEVTVLHEFGPRARTVWRSPTAFTRVEIEAPDLPEVRVSLALHRRRLMVGAQVGPQERMEFAEALQAAIRRARSERYSPS